MEDYSKGWIDLGDINPEAFIRTVYELSCAQGRGFLVDQSSGISREEISPWVADLARAGRVRLDYIKGRSCKMSLHKHDGRYFVREGSWYDHTDTQFDELLKRFGVTREAKPDHGGCCECDDCKPNNPNRDPAKVFQGVREAR